MLPDGLFPTEGGTRVSLMTKAKELFTRRGGVEAAKEDAQELKDIATGEGTMKEKATEAVEAIKEPGAPGEPAAPTGPDTPEQREPGAPGESPADRPPA
jgi:hypothetical protein